MITLSEDLEGSEDFPSPGLRGVDSEEKVILSGGEDEDDLVFYTGGAKHVSGDFEDLSGNLLPPCPEEDPADEIVDEWEDDNDTGYLLEPISEQDFFDIEEVPLDLVWD